MARMESANGPAFFRACAAGAVERLRALTAQDDRLVRERTPEGSTCLHLAVRHPDAVRLLIERGADPNARDAGDNASPLHFAAAAGVLESVRLLLEAGADVHGEGDLHDGGVLTAAGARQPGHLPPEDFAKEMAALARSVRKSAPMFAVRDVRATVRWYESIGFTVADRHENDGELVFAPCRWARAS